MTEIEEKLKDTPHIVEDTDMESKSFNEGDTSPTTSQKIQSQQGNREIQTVKVKKRTIGAHKAVLSQRPYFEALFEGGFAESGAGVKQIRLKDTKTLPFVILMHFM